jgi:hypothetical protein
MAALVQVTSIKQAEPIASPASVQIDFNVLGILPDLVQVSASGISGDIGILKDEVEMSPPEISYTSTIELAGGSFFSISLCPRTVTNGVLDEKMDDQPWETFCTFTTIITKAPGTAPPPPPGVPSITSIEPNQPTLNDSEGNIVVRWQNSPADKYHFMWTDEVPPPLTLTGWSAVELNAENSKGFAFQIPHALVGRTYTFKVQSCKVFFIGSDLCSAFCPNRDIVMPKNTNSLREFLRISGVQLNPGIRSLGASAFGAGIRAMMHL